MSNNEFEEFLIPLLQSLGYSVSKTSQLNVTFILRKRGIKAVAYLKRHHTTLGITSVQEALDSKVKTGANKVFVITNHYFTRTARILAAEKKVTLVNREALHALINGPLKDRRSHRFIERVRILWDDPKPN